MSKTYKDIQSLKNVINTCELYKGSSYERILQQTIRVFFQDKDAYSFTVNWGKEERDTLRELVYQFTPIKDGRSFEISTYKNEIINAFEETEVYHNLLHTVRMQERDFYDLFMQKIEQLMCSPIEICSKTSFYEELYNEYGLRVDMDYDKQLTRLYEELHKRYKKELERKQGVVKEVPKKKKKYPVVYGNAANNKAFIEAMKEVCMQLDDSIIVTCRDFMYTEKKNTEFKLFSIQYMQIELTMFDTFEKMNVSIDDKDEGIRVDIYYPEGYESLLFNFVDVSKLKRSYVQSSLEELKKFHRIPISMPVYKRCLKGRDLTEGLIEQISEKAQMKLMQISKEKNQKCL